MQFPPFHLLNVAPLCGALVEYTVLGHSMSAAALIIMAAEGSLSLGAVTDNRTHRLWRPKCAQNINTVQ